MTRFRHFDSVSKQKLSDIAKNREIFRVHLGLLPPCNSPAEIGYKNEALKARKIVFNNL